MHQQIIPHLHKLLSLFSEYTNNRNQKTLEALKKGFLDFFNIFFAVYKKAENHTLPVVEIDFKDFPAALEKLFSQNEDKKFLEYYPFIDEITTASDILISMKD